MSWVSRADIARMQRASKADAPDAARLFGFKWSPAPAATTEQTRAPSPSRPPPVAGAPVPSTTLDMPVWQIVNETHAPDEPAIDDNESADRPVPEPGDALWRLPTPPANAWSAIWPAIFELVADELPGNAIEASALIDILSQGRPLERIPRRRHRRWPQRLRVWVDRDDRLVPIWDDQAAVVERLQQVCGVVDYTVGRHDFVAHSDDTVLLLGEPSLLPRSIVKRAPFTARLTALSPRSGARRGWRVRAWAAQSTTDSVRALMVLLTQALLVQPGMLRDLRLLLPGAGLDTELDVFAHDGLDCAQYDGLMLKPAVADALRDEFAALPDTLQGAVAEVVERWSAGLPEEVQLLEATIWSGSEAGPFDYERARALLDALAADVRAGAPELQDFAKLAAGRLAPAIDQHPELERSISTLWAAGNPEADAEVPRGINPAAASELTPGGDVRRWTLCQRGAEWRGVPVGAAYGVPLARLDTWLPTWWITIDGQRRKRPIDRPLEVGTARRVIIETERSAVELALQPPPEWADEMGRDADGLWIAVTIAGEREVLRRKGTSWVQRGTGLGADGFGVYEDVYIGEVRVRFRLIRAGEFIMGSPEDEAGRWEDEGPQHAVRLTEDFWLADTPTTQALWVEVMGENPSEFKHPNRPVEQVSWEDVEGFLNAANAQRPGLKLRLPTEAQWEYACRAGTTAATWAGNLEILGKNNAPVLDEIAWYGGNSGVDLDIKGYDASGWSERQYETPEAATRAVRGKAANPWGLYDMLGNVFEWCADWNGPYPSDAQVDPSGPEAGSDRVLRGGSWNDTARLVRAASRYGAPPGVRYDFLGFRLSRGPAPSARSAEPPRSGPEQRSDFPPGTGGSEGQARSAGGGASPRTPQPSEAAQTKRSIFSRLFGRKEDE